MSACVDSVSAGLPGDQHCQPQPQQQQQQQPAPSAPRPAPPQLIEELKAFLGDRAHSKQVADVLASPCLPTTPPQPLPRRADVDPTSVASAMSSEDDPLPPSSPGPAGPGPAGDSSASVSEHSDCTPDSTAAIAGPSLQEEGEDEARRRESTGSARGLGSPDLHPDRGLEPTSLEDKCLECCIYYGVLCCQCSIM